MDRIYRHSLAGDVILAAQVLSLELRAGEYVVATKNVKHLVRLGLDATEWPGITP